MSSKHLSEDYVVCLPQSWLPRIREEYGIIHYFDIPEDFITTFIIGSDELCVDGRFRLMGSTPAVDAWLTRLQTQVFDAARSDDTYMVFVGWRKLDDVSQVFNSRDLVLQILSSNDMLSYLTCPFDPTLHVVSTVDGAKLLTRDCLVDSLDNSDSGLDETYDTSTEHESEYDSDAETQQNVAAEYQEFHKQFEKLASYESQAVLNKPQHVSRVPMSSLGVKVTVLRIPSASRDTANWRLVMSSMGNLISGGLLNAHSYASQLRENDNEYQGALSKLKNYVMRTHRKLGQDHGTLVIDVLHVIATDDLWLIGMYPYGEVELPAGVTHDVEPRGQLVLDIPSDQHDGSVYSSLFHRPVIPRRHRIV